jgi:hypothetical protein
LQEVVCCRTFTKVSSERPRVKRKRNLTSVTSSCKFVDSTYSLFFHFFLFPLPVLLNIALFFFHNGSNTNICFKLRDGKGVLVSKGPADSVLMCWWKEGVQLWHFCQIKRTRDLAANFIALCKNVNVVFAWQAPIDRLYHAWPYMDFPADSGN